MNSDRLDLVLDCNEEEATYIHEKLIEHNIKFITHFEEFKFCLKDYEGKIIGGIIASKDNECMTIDFLWVDEDKRGKGLGRILVNHLEAVAERRGCVVIWLNTFEFQGPEFYKRMNYELFGTLEKCINGYSQYFFRKALKPSSRR